MHTSALCLPDGIPERDRAYLKNGAGGNTPIKLLAFDWASAKLVSFIAKIVIEEAHGS